MKTGVKCFLRATPLVVVMLSCCARVPAATLLDWSVGLSVYTSFQNAGTGGGFGVRASASDGFDSHDRLLEAGPRVYIGSFHQSGTDGWSGAPGFYGVDLRSPFSIMGQSKTWRLYIWGDPSLPLGAHQLWFNFGYANIRSLEDSLWVTLTLVSTPAGVDGAPPPGTVYPLPQTTGLPPFPVYRTDNGLEGYVFDLTATVVPEPSSLLALSAGLAGMAGALRRRVR